MSPAVISNVRLIQGSHSISRAFSFSAKRLRIDKVLPSAAEALHDLKSDSTVLCGGFGLCGVPDTLIHEVGSRRNIRHLTCVSNNAGLADCGLGLLLQSGQVRKMIASYVGENKVFSKLYFAGQLEVELTPQGTLAERCRAGGAGIPAFYTPAAVGTVVQTGDSVIKYGQDGTPATLSQPRDVRVFNGKSHVMEEAIHGDYALVKAWKADRLGNVVFRLAANNFNGVMARNAKITIVEAEHIVEPGELDPNTIHVPGIYVDRVIQSTFAKSVEKVINKKDSFSGMPRLQGAAAISERQQKRERIVRRAAKEFKNGMYANLGIGMPMMAPNYVDEGVQVVLQSENGILGLGPYPAVGQEDPDLINAGKETVSLLPGASCFGSEESFGMIRAGKLDLTILGAVQVSACGDLANWMLPGNVKGFGGAMDLVSNPDDTRVIVTMEHTDKNGGHKILPHCEYPLTGRTCVSRIITDLCVFDVNWKTGLTLVEIANDVTIDHVKSKTGAPFKVAHDLKLMW